MALLFNLDTSISANRDISKKIWDLPASVAQLDAHTTGDQEMRVQPLPV